MNDEVYRELYKEEIITKDHYGCYSDKFVLLPSNYPYIGKKADNARKENDDLPEYNTYAKKKTQFNFETLNILKDIEL
jgi:hypothetical protein